MADVKNIKEKLNRELTPEYLKIEDESHQHAGHNPASRNGGTHVSLCIVSDVFEGKNRIERQRKVMNILAKELAHSLHALKFEGLFTPKEWNKK